MLFVAVFCFLPTRHTGISFLTKTTECDSSCGEINDNRRLFFSGTFCTTKQRKITCRSFRHSQRCSLRCPYDEPVQGSESSAHRMRRRRLCITTATFLNMHCVSFLNCLEHLLWQEVLRVTAERELQLHWSSREKGESKELQIKVNVCRFLTTSHRSKVHRRKEATRNQSTRQKCINTSSSCYKAVMFEIRFIRLIHKATNQGPKTDSKPVGLFFILFFLWWKEGPWI